MALDVVTRFGDWVRRYKTQPHEEKLYVETRQANRGAVLEAVRTLRENAEQRPLEWGRWALSIPFEDYEELCRRNPALRTGDKAAWDRFIASDESWPYRIHDKGPRYHQGGSA